jgi:hypothetical protein
LHVEVSTAVIVTRVEKVSSLTKSQEYVQGLRPWKTRWAVESQAKGVTPTTLILVAVEIALPNPRCSAIGTKENVEVTDLGDILAPDALAVQMDDATEFRVLAPFEKSVFDLADLNIGRPRPHRFWTTAEQGLKSLGSHELRD